MTRTPHIAVVGGGPAGLMAAETLVDGGATVAVYDRMPSLGRKFLLAGRGGLNLTHTEPHSRFMQRYREAEGWLSPQIEAFDQNAMVAWCEALGQPTFVGSSGRVFPRAMKASPLLRAWLARLAGKGVQVALRHHWTGWTDDGALRFAAPSGDVIVRSDATVLALGGASWPRLGSDGGWQGTLAQSGITVAPLVASNAGVFIAWSEHLRDRFAGAPLKRIALTIGSEQVKGEAVLTETGLEGGAIYALSSPIRQAIAATGRAALWLDLRPDLTHDALLTRLAARRPGASLSTSLQRHIGLSPAAIAVLREAGPPPLDGERLAGLIKAVPLTVTRVAGLERAVSSAGGVGREALDHTLMAIARPGMFVAGEMIDWDAPTGGYLLQACFATGQAAARGALAWLAEQQAR